MKILEHKYTSICLTLLDNRDLNATIPIAIGIASKYLSPFPKMPGVLVPASL